MSVPCHTTVLVVVVFALRLARIYVWESFSESRVSETLSAMSCYGCFGTITRPHPIMHSAVDDNHWFSPKMCRSSSCWVWFRLRGLIKAYQDNLSTPVWSKCACCVDTCPNKPRQGGKQTLVRFNQSKWGRCERSRANVAKMYNSGCRANCQCVQYVKYNILVTNWRHFFYVTWD